MIEKTFSVNTKGFIEKDFINRNISQYLHNAIQVNVDIPKACFQNLDNYGVELAIELMDKTGRKLKDLATLVLMLNEQDMGEYDRYSCVLTIAYTKELGLLKMTPYIRTTTTEIIDGVETTFISIQQTFTNTYLNIEFAVPNTSSVELEDAPIITQLENMIISLQRQVNQLQSQVNNNR